MADKCPDCGREKWQHTPVEDFPCGARTSKASHELLPCPFCGTAPQLEDSRTIWIVRCLSCTACVLGERAPEPEREMGDAYWARFEQSAVDRWNKRVAHETSDQHKHWCAKLAPPVYKPMECNCGASEKASEHCRTGDYPCRIATETTDRMTKGRCIYCGLPSSEPEV